MKQVVQNYKSGDLDVLDVPVPATKPGGVLVASRFSLISTGTELMKVNEGQLSLLAKARARPDQLRKVVETATQLGPVAAYQKAMNRLDSYTPLGYSLCGVVIDVGRGAEEFTVGDRVACAGNEHALHAEVNWVPTNLCVPVPDGVDERAASFVTVGAIAMHGVRRGEVQLGEVACVVGLGLIGQLVVRLLVAAGVRVVGIDPVAERCTLAESAGALTCGPPSADGMARIEQALSAATNGLGADHVFITASGSSNEPVVAAARVARDRARVVDIGKTRLDLPWNDYYEKELDVRFSRSYGPGRYDPTYELQGIDYPVGYVRWTERRNLACFLDLLANGDIELASLISGTFPVAEAVDVYRRLAEGELKGIGFLFGYPDSDQHAPAPAAAAERDVPTRTATSGPRPQVGAAGRLRVGFIGAGNYATSMLLPHLRGREDVELAQVATTTALSALNAQRKFGFTTVSTDTEALLSDESIGAVFIVTRHSSHADLACRALEQGKAVFVEKPLALSVDEVDRILKVVAETGNDRLMVGFNRRFAPLFTDLAARFGTPRGPATVRYLVNAGPLDRRSWYRDATAEGSRFEGEGGHFIDTISWWLDARLVEVHAVEAGSADDVLVTLRYDDGSAATITYTTAGSPRFPKETFDAVAGGRVARLDNFRRTVLWKGRRRHGQRAMGGTDKGQRREIEAFLEVVRSGAPMPIPLASLVATTKATLAVARSAASGRPERV